jgi:hypothetical protein
MMVLDMTAQLAPILWGTEVLLLVSVGWLVAAYVLQEWQRHRERLLRRNERVTRTQNAKLTDRRVSGADLGFPTGSQPATPF